MQYQEYGVRRGLIGPSMRGAPVGFLTGARARYIAREQLREIMRLPLPVEIRRRMIRQWRAINLPLIQQSNAWRRTYRRW